MLVKKLIEQELEPAPVVKKPQPQRVAPWYSPEAMKRSKIASIETDIARMKQQILKKIENLVLQIPHHIILALQLAKQYIN